MNKKTAALTTEQYNEIIGTMRRGFAGCRPNERIATALVLEGNLGLRISDVLRLRLCDIVRDGDRYRLEIVEQKTGKCRAFTVPLVIQQYICIVFVLKFTCSQRSPAISSRRIPNANRMIKTSTLVPCALYSTCLNNSSGIAFAHDGVFRGASK